MYTRFRLLPNGRIVGKHYVGAWIDITENSCIDGVQNYGESEFYSGDALDQIVVTCPVPGENAR